MAVGTIQNNGEARVTGEFCDDRRGKLKPTYSSQVSLEEQKLQKECVCDLLEFITVYRFYIYKWDMWDIYTYFYIWDVIRMTYSLWSR